MLRKPHVPAYRHHKATGQAVVTRCRSLSARRGPGRHHKATGQAVVTLGGRDYYLGPYGTESSRQAYNRLVAEWLSGSPHPPV